MLPLRDDVPPGRAPAATAALVAVLLLVFLVVQRPGLTLGEGAVDAGTLTDWGAIPAELTGRAPDPDGPPAWLTALTSGLLHGGWLHLLPNLLVLWIFGRTLEGALGPARFLAVYLLGTLVALAAHVAADPGSTAPLVGASGGVAAVLGAYALTHPRARVLGLLFVVLFFTTVEFPALVLIGVWLVVQVALAAADLAAGTAGGVAEVAHLGGFLGGLALAAALGARPHRPAARITPA